MIAEIHQVLSPVECRLFILHARNKLDNLRVAGRGHDPSVRNGTGSWIKEPVYDDKGNDIDLKLRTIASRLTNKPIHNMEFTHVVRYGLGGEYKEHYDTFSLADIDAKYSGKQREFSLLVYLNENFSGGETVFTKRGITIKPSMGKLLMWSNLDDQGSVDPLSKHAGMPIMAGEKWIAIIWVRTSPIKKPEGIVI